MHGRSSFSMSTGVEERANMLEVVNSAGHQEDDDYDCDYHNERSQSAAEVGSNSTTFFQAVFGPPSLTAAASPTKITSSASPGGEVVDGDIMNYWQNYDLSVSEAPKLFSDAEFQAVKRIRYGLEVLILRKRLKERVLMRNREREERAAVRIQAIVRGRATRTSSPAVRERHLAVESVKREYKRFKRDLRSGGFAAYVYRHKDGALRKVTLKPNGKLDCLCWSMGVAKVKTGSVPLVALKKCYAGYPKRDFPTKSMQARATPLPNKDKTFTLQRDNGQVYVFTSAEDVRGLSRAQMVRGLQAIIDEISSPDSFYFDGNGVLRRVTSSIFDDRGNTAQREARRKQRHERFRSRQEDVKARRAALRQQGSSHAEVVGASPVPTTIASAPFDTPTLSPTPGGTRDSIDVLVLQDESKQPFSYRNIFGPSGSGSANPLLSQSPPQDDGEIARRNAVQTGEFKREELILERPDGREDTFDGPPTVDDAELGGIQIKFDQSRICQYENDGALCDSATNVSATRRRKIRLRR